MLALLILKVFMAKEFIPRLLILRFLASTVLILVVLMPSSA